MLEKEEFKQYIKNRMHRPNSKYYLKYYIGKDLYELFDYCIIYKNNFEIEFFSRYPNHKKIWDKMNVYENYGYCKLVDCEYDENYDCYTVSVVCADLLDYLRSCHDYGSPWSEKLWKDRAKSCGWSDTDVDEGYSKYKLDYDIWFERNFGKHVSFL